MNKGRNDLISSPHDTVHTTAESLVAETHKNVNRIIAIEKAQKRNRTTGERIAKIIAEFCGSMTFVWVHVVWFGSWIIVNQFFPSLKFDPFPFTFLTLVVSLEAIFLSTFILISQNHETKLTERRNHLDLQINMLSEQENTTMLEILRQIAEKVGVDCDDLKLDVFEQEMKPEKLVEQILAADPATSKSESIIIKP